MKRNSLFSRCRLKPVCFCGHWKKIPKELLEQFYMSLTATPITLERLNGQIGYQIRSKIKLMKEMDNNWKCEYCGLPNTIDLSSFLASYRKGIEAELRKKIEEIDEKAQSFGMSYQTRGLIDKILSLLDDKRQ